MTTEHEQPNQSSAFKGLQDRQVGIELPKSSIPNLLKQYNDFIDGYDSVDAGKAAPK
jgi:hypothetical protein